MANLLNPASLSPNRNSLNNGNFAVQESPESAARPKGYFVGFLFEILSVAAAFGVGYEYFRYLTHIGSLRFVIALSAVFLVMHVIAFLLVREKMRRFVVLVFETGALLFFFANFPNLKLVYYLSIALVLLGFMLLGEHESRSEMENSLKFKFRKSAQPLIAKLVSALVLLGVLLSLPQLQNDQHFFVSRNFTNLSGWGSALLQKFYPDFSQDASARDIARKWAEAQAEKDPRFQQLDAKSREAALDQSADEIVKNFATQSSTTVSSSTPLNAVLTQFTNATLQGWYEKSPTVFLFLWAVLLFFVFRGFGAIVGIAIVALAFVIYEVLIAMNIIHLNGESRIHETIEYS